jgi:DHA1 family multidrug resistance protein-like MFS transporter
MIQRLRFPDTFDRDLRLLSYSMSVRRVTMGFTMLIRSIYFALLGFSPVQIGLLLSIGTFVSALHHISFGMLSDRFGRKPFIVMGGVFSLLRLVIFAISRDFWILALGQGIGAMGEGAGAGQPVVSGYIADKTSRQDRGQVFSTLAITNGLASTLGSLMAGLPLIFQNTMHMDEVTAHGMLFWLGAIISIPSLLLLLPLRDVQRQTGAGLEESADATSGDRDRNWGVIAKFSLVRSTSGVGWGFIQSLMSLYFFTQFGAGGEVLGPITSLARLLSVFTYTLAPAMVRRWGEVRPLIVTRVISAALAIALSLTPWYFPAILLLIALRVVIMSTMPIRQTLAAGIVDQRDTATAIGISNFARMGLRTVAPTVAGYMFEVISPSMPFASGAIFLVVNAFLYRAWFRPKKEERGSAPDR